MVSGSILVIALALVLDAVFVGLQKIAQGGHAPVLSTHLNTRAPIKEKT